MTTFILPLISCFNPIYPSSRLNSAVAGCVWSVDSPGDLPHVPAHTVQEGLEGQPGHRDNSVYKNGQDDLSYWIETENQRYIISVILFPPK